MISKVYLNAAHQAIRDSYQANGRGEYFTSWGKTIPARTYFLIDAVINTGALPFYAIKSGCGAGEALFTWGRETSWLQEGLKGIDNSLARVILGSVGAIVSPAAACAIESDSGSELIAQAAVIAAVVAGVAVIAKNFRFPNLILYNHQTGFTWGWH